MNNAQTRKTQNLSALNLSMQIARLPSIVVNVIVDTIHNRYIRGRKISSSLGPLVPSSRHGHCPLFNTIGLRTVNRQSPFVYTNVIITHASASIVQIDNAHVDGNRILLRFPFFIILFFSLFTLFAYAIPSLYGFNSYTQLLWSPAQFRFTF